MVRSPLLLLSRAMDLTRTGLSLLGTLTAPTFPQFLSGVRTYHDKPLQPQRLTLKSPFRMASLGAQGQLPGLILMKIHPPPVRFVIRYRISPYAGLSHLNRECFLKMYTSLQDPRCNSIL